MIRDIQQFSIPNENNEFTIKIEPLADQVLQAKAADALSDTTDLESAIDLLVYGLFGLSDEEVALVEG
jgi:adenine-specific DNA-methyltransferase